LIFIVYALWAAPTLGQPWTITVTTDVDVVNNPWADCPPPGTNDCSLREAITVANYNGAPGDTIVFAPSLDGSTITLTLGTLWIVNENQTTIDATALTTGITINANGIQYPLSLNSSQITIQGKLTITNAGAGGTAVALNTGANNAVLDGITISNNGNIGISVADVSNATIQNVTVSNNGSAGISLWNSSASGVQIISSTITDNGGTGIYVNAPGTIIDGTTVSRNQNGGISVDTSALVGTQVQNSIIEDNTNGSGIYTKAQIAVDNSTIRRNVGGITLDVGANISSITNSTIASNNPSGIFIRQVSQALIQGNMIQDNYAEGVNVSESDNITIQSNTIRDNGQNGLSSGVFVFGNSNIISISNNTIHDNGGNGITLQEDFGTGNAPENVSIVDNAIFGNGFLAIDGVGIQIAGAVQGSTFPNVRIQANEIYSNAAQGILIERTPSGSDGPQNVLIGADFWERLPEASRNYIYDNGQEGVLIRDLGTSDNLVRYNSIGVDPSNNPAPNGNSGVSLFAGTQNNSVLQNFIRYNRYQNVLISGAGTSSNVIANNTIQGGADASPSQGYDNAGVVINNGATNNTVGRNVIQWHVFDGVQVVGPGTDDNQIVGNEISRNGRGVAVIQDYPDATPPDPDAPPFDLQTDSFTNPGPANTLIASNTIVNNNNDGVLIRRDGGRTIIQDNTIQNNGAGASGDGIRLVGASPRIEQNIIENNAENGVHALVFFGLNDDPATANDDVLSTPTIQNNTFGGNGTAVPGDNVGVGIYAVDTPLGDLRAIHAANTWSAPDDVARIQQDWYGYVRVEDSGGNPVSGETVVIEQRGDASGWGWTYVSAVDDGNGNYGPSGFTRTSERTYFLIVAERVTNDGTYQNFTPQRVYLQSDPGAFVEYAYNGQFPDPAGEPGGAIESPPGSGWDRYEFALLQQEAPPVGGDPPIWGSIVAFPTPELPFGSGPDRDLNGDGNLNDCVLRYQDLSTKIVYNTGVIVSCTPGDVDLYESTIVFVDGQGQLGLYNVRGGEVQRTRIEGRQPSIHGTRVAFETPEGQVALWDLVTGHVEALAPGREPALWGSLVAFRGPQGTVQIYDLSKHELVDTGAQGRQPAIYQNIVAFTAPAPQLGKGVEVIRYFDVSTGGLYDTGAVGTHPAVWDGWIVFQTEERLARQDLNGDGDRRDIVIGYYDIGTHQVYSTGLVGYEPDVYEKTVAFWSYEPELKQDINGDGDTHDPVVLTYKIGDAHLLPRAKPRLQILQGTGGIRFEVRGLGSQAQVKLQIFDLAGHRVYEAQAQGAETPQLFWRLSDRSGRPVANGVYLYVLQVEDPLTGHLERVVGKLVVLR
jgi:parallel beta-helix repeat protein